MIRFNAFQYEIDGSRSFNQTTRRFSGPNALAVANAFEQRVFGFLTTIDADAQVGKRILRGVGLGHTIRILAGNGLFNRVTSVDAFGKGQKVQGQNGTGRGADGTIIFSLDQIDSIMGPAAQKEAILLHEIVHAIRATWGVESTDSVPGYEDIEEFFAITVTNIYVSSAYPGSSFRGDHGSSAVHSKRLSGAPDAFISNPGLAEQDLRLFVMAHRTELLRFIDEMEAMALSLSEAKCKFNPFRVCYKGYNPDVEEASIPKERRRQGFGPLTRETFADAADRVLKNAVPGIF